MKKIFTLVIVLTAIIQSANAQPGHGPMTFAGKANFYASVMGNKAGETEVLSDTVIYSAPDFIMPSVNYNGLIVPSFTIKNPSFSGGYGGVVWEEQSFSTTTIDQAGEEKAVTGTLKGSFTHDGDVYKLALEVTLSYGKMPFPVTYSIEGYYVKDYAGENQVVCGEYGPYKAAVTYKLRTYMEDNVKKMDVEVPAYSLAQTAIGDLSLGTYIVKGLTYDESKGGFYRDYAADGLTMNFKAVNGGLITMEGDYPLSREGSENILVEMVDGKAKITNIFMPGDMPFSITAIMDQTVSTAISQVRSQSADTEGVTFNLQGQRVGKDMRGIVVRNGKKYIVR